MTESRQLDPYTSPRAFYGAELRRLREEAGLTQAQLGERAFCSGAYIGQFETAVRRPQMDVSKLFDDILGSGGHLQRLCRLARETKHPEYFADAAELEKLATTISDYSPMLVPGVLQTAEYARALTSAAQPFASMEEVEGHVTARLERARLLDRPNAPELWTVIHEAAIRIPVGGPAVMRDQLLHLAEVARAYRRVKLQVLPDSAGEHAFLNGLVCLMTFEDAPPVVYTEGAYTGQLIEEPRLVAHYGRAYDFVRAAALPMGASLALIESAAKDYTTP